MAAWRDRASRRLLAALPVLVALAAGTARADCQPGHATGQRGDVLRVGFTRDPPLVIAGADAEPGGLALDVLRALARRQGWRLELVEVGAESMPARLAACELDVGVTGVPVSAALARSADFSLPYLYTVTTAVVRAGDARRAGAVEPRSGHRLLGAAARGIAGAIAALALLAVAAWLLNLATGLLGRGLPGRRVDAAVNGPWAAVRWLGWSRTGRLLGTLWCGVGLLVGAASSTGGSVRALAGEDPLRQLVEEAARLGQIVGERVPDGDHMHCVSGATQACYRGFADGTVAALAGPRELLCAGVESVALDRVALREDLAVPQHFAYLLPPGSPLRVRLDLALLTWREEQGLSGPAGRCPGGGW